MLEQLRIPELVEGQSFFRLASLALLVTLVFAPDWAAAAPFDAETAVQAYLAEHASTCSAKAAQCDAIISSGALKGWAMFVILPLLLIGYSLSGLADRAVTLAERLCARRRVQALLMAIPILGIVALHRLITSLFLGPAQCGAKIKNPDGSWTCLSSGWGNLIESLFSYAFMIGGVGIGLLLLRGLLEKAPHKSWMVAALAFLCWNISGATSSNIYSNQGRTLPDGALKERIYEMAETVGFPKDRIQIGEIRSFAGIRQAQLSGFGQWQRINIGPAYWPQDNGEFVMHTVNGQIARPPTPDQTVAIVGHELAHFQMRHLEKSYLFVTLVGITLCWLAFFAARILLFLSLRRGRTGALGDWRALPLVLGAFLMAFAIFPRLTNAFILYNEREADLVGLDIAKLPDDFARFVLNGQIGGPISHRNWEDWFFLDHPSGEERIRTAMQWKARQLRLSPKSQLAPSPSRRVPRP